VGIGVIDNEKSWSLRVDARRRITLYYQTQASLQGTGSEPLGLGPSSSVENRNSLACLRNAGSYSAEWYCSADSHQKKTGSETIPPNV